MSSYSYLLDLAIILLCTKFLGILTRRVQMPQVVGALLAGLVLGPAGFGVLTETSFIKSVAEIGVIILMFSAGMETDIKELKASGKASFVIALCGVIVPLLGGFGVAWFFNRPDMIESTAKGSIFLQNIFIGVILTATSVSITVETLKELGKLKTRSGNAILGAAIIDDILGIIALTIVTSMADASVSLTVVLLKIVGFFAFSGIVGFLFYKLYRKWVDDAKKELHRHTIVAFVFCLLMAYIAEEVFGVADITGAFIAGLIISNVRRANYLERKFDILSYLLLSPVFFASIGLKVVLPKMSGAIIGFAVALTIVAVLTKVIGCGIGAKLCGYKNYQVKRIGVGMISRGEVALIVASKGDSMGLMSPEFLGPVIIVVVITTIVTPILLKIVFGPGTASVPEQVVPDSERVTSYYENAAEIRGEEYEKR
ncbi:MULTISPECIES: cation:proton antiporter [Lachnospiraceae]|jgi:Kef-type K+ transport system membrane component KefB|uniref:Cation:proton antiporter n=1 Tax=Faecalicatena acetigenes TaxID=2981790 RepID=A0ABT2TDA0_9FIRM|nr:MULTISPECIES: cation:proton antiporter [Lachnospiraceae]MCU6748249.1 cation:proton antiporter [Faecalicatena acetigenes]RGT70101.1 cation:proton antiporter [Ruminococcus sp. AF18-22]SCI33546.1 K(+)/H(+) antiporter [uncultured Clostridium sp.]